MNELIKTFKGSQVELEYLLTGENNLETVMFVHGAGANLRQYFAQHENFSDEYKVLSVSLRGHGLSGHPKIRSGEHYSLGRNRDDILELLEFLKINKVHYVGNSAGGIIGFYIHDKNPHLLNSITTFGMTGELKYSAFTTKIISGIDKAMIRWNPRRYFSFLSKNISKNKSVQKEVLDMFMMSTEAVPYIRLNLGNYSCLNIIQTMNIPYLLIQGDQDKEINRSLGTTLEVLTTNKRALVVKLEEAGHITNMDRPDEFNEILETFWKQIPIEN